MSRWEILIGFFAFKNKKEGIYMNENVTAQ